MPFEEGCPRLLPGEPTPVIDLPVFTSACHPCLCCPLTFVVINVKCVIWLFDFYMCCDSFLFLYENSVTHFSLFRARTFVLHFSLSYLLMDVVSGFLCHYYYLSLLSVPSLLITSVSLRTIYSYSTIDFLLLNPLQPLLFVSPKYPFIISRIQAIPHKTTFKCT